MKRLAAIALTVAACTSNVALPSTASPTVVPGAISPAPAQHTDGPQASTPANASPGVHEGFFSGDQTGLITFGTDYDPGTLQVIQAVTMFDHDVPAIAWSASLSEAVHTADIDIVITTAPTPGTIRQIFKQTVHVSDRGSNRFADKVDLAGLVQNKVGSYEMHFIRFDEGLAQGSFTLR